MFTLKTLKNALRFQGEYIISCPFCRPSGRLGGILYQHFSFSQSVSSSLDE